jgi:pyruvate formate lyase activating enzyme
MTQEALDLLGPYLDAYRVDLKGFSAAAYQKIAHLDDFKGILDVITRARFHWGMHVEIITNLIPSLNDHEPELANLARWIHHHLGPETPWHVTRFVPHLNLSHLPATPVSKLEMARKIGLKEGLQYVYLGNVPGHRAENTYCPKCRELLIERFNFRILQYHLKGNKCAFCSREIFGSFEP